MVGKIVHEWNGHLEIFSRPQVTENSRQWKIHLKANIRLEYCTNDLSFSSGIVMQAKFANRTLVSSHQKSWQNLGKKSPV